VVFIPHLCRKTTAFTRSIPLKKPFRSKATLARFLDALGNPGNFSGFSLSIGFGKYF